jgi:hypothetical protein
MWLSLKGLSITYSACNPSKAFPSGSLIMHSLVLTIYVIDSQKLEIYSSNMRKVMAAIKRGISRHPREIESVLAFECSIQWDALRKVDGEESQRFCNACSKNVYLTLDDLAYHENARRGRCISIPAGTKLKINGKDVTTNVRLGGGPPPPPQFSPPSQ